MTGPLKSDLRAKRSTTSEYAKATGYQIKIDSVREPKAT